MDLAAEASQSRATGDFERAIELYTQAEASATSMPERLHLAMRRAYCLTDIGDVRASVAIAEMVVAEARAHEIVPEMCDALGLLVDDHMLNERRAEAMHLLAEARYLLDQLPDDPANYQAVHNLAVTYERSDFPNIALDLFERALPLAGNAEDRAFVRSGMAAAYHLAMMNEPDELARERHIENGIRVTTSVIESTEAKEESADAAALAHRAWFLNARGRYEEALSDAIAARTLSAAHRLDMETVVSLLGEAVARWNLHHDPLCIDLIEQAWETAEGPWVRRFPAAAWPVLIEALWHHGRFEEARAAMARQNEQLQEDLRRERAARLAYVELGIEHRHTEHISETDPLTGLYNRRYLTHLLPEALLKSRPICVAVFDLDGFKQVNDEHSYEQGDSVLQQVAHLIRDSCRGGDCVVRLGGDEFVMVLGQILPDEARAVLDRVRESVSCATWRGMEDDFSLTTSVGVAVGTSVAQAHRIVAEASAAVREAKRSGRNRIIFS